MNAPDREITYRIATRHDHAEIVQMLAELMEELVDPELAAKTRPRFHDDIASALGSPRVRIFLAESPAGAVGLSRGDVLTDDPIFRLRDDHRCGYIDQMFVRPAHRDGGVGAELLRLCEAWFRSQEIYHCLLHAAPRAVRFYARIGYGPNREMFKRLD